MKRFVAIGLVAILCAAAVKMQAALVYPFLTPVRTMVGTNIAAVTNRAELSPQERREFRSLIQARNLIDRSGRTSLVNDLQVFANVSAVLSRGFPEGDFDSLLLAALAEYRAVLIDAALTLGTNVSQLPPSPATSAAGNTIADTLDLLEGIDTTEGISAGNRALTMAALRLHSVQTVLSRPAAGRNRANVFTARIDGQFFRANPNGISFTYNPVAEFMIITGREVSGVPSSSRTITLFLQDVTPGTTSHFFGSPGTGTYATYSEQGVTNSATFTSRSGHAMVTLDAATGSISGRFSFDAVDALEPGAIARVSNGNFSTRTQ